MHCELCLISHKRPAASRWGAFKMVTCVADDSLNLLLIAMVTITMVYVIRGLAATQAINMAPGIRNSDWEEDS